MRGSKTFWYVAGLVLVALAQGCVITSHRDTVSTLSLPVLPPGNDDRPVASQQSDIQIVSVTQPDDGEVSPIPTVIDLDEVPATLVADAETSVSPVSLLVAIDRVLESNPDLIAARAQENVSRSMIGVAETYPFNPVLQTRVLPWSRTDDGRSTSVNHYVLFWQTIELAHQQRYRKASANMAWNEVRWTIAQTELQYVAQTVGFYFAALYQKDLHDLTVETKSLSDELLSVLERQFDRGSVSASDVALARLDADTAHQQERLAHANYLTAIEAMRRQLNWQKAEAIIFVETMDDYEWMPTIQAHDAFEACEGAITSADSEDELPAIVASVRPDVLAAQSRMASLQANVSLANASRMPNLRLGPFYNRDGGATVFLGFQAETEVPIANSGRPLLNQRIAELRQQQIIWQQLLSRASIEAETAIDRYERARDMSASLATRNGEELPVELKKLEDLYERGEIDILRVIQARTSFIQQRRARLDALNELAQSASALIQATGLPPHAIVHPSLETSGRLD